MADGKDLAGLRKEINNIDRHLVKLFEMRMKVVESVADYKHTNNLKIYDKEREAAVLKQNLAQIKDPTMKRELEKVFMELMETSKDHQRQWICDKYKNRDITIGFQGVKGSFSDRALSQHFGSEMKRLSYLTFEDLFQSLEEGKVDYIVAPVENSSTGCIGEIYDLSKTYEACIVGEEYISIEHHLLGVKGTSLDTIEEVYSHPQGFMQCRKFLSDYPSWHTIPYYNTAKSAAYVSSQKNTSYGAIGSSDAAEIYGLEIIERNIQTNKLNTTRFAVFSKAWEVSNIADKISIHFNISHQPGVLVEAMKHLANNQINMLKIESRPIADKPWEYDFFLDIEGNLLDDHVKVALDNVEKNCEKFVIMGNYKKYDGLFD